MLCPIQSKGASESEPESSTVRRVQDLKKENTRHKWGHTKTTVVQGVHPSGGPNLTPRELSRQILSTWQLTRCP